MNFIIDELVCNFIITRPCECKYLSCHIFIFCCAYSMQFSASLFLFYLLNLPCDFKGQVQRAFGGFAADDGRLFFADAVDEALQFQLERFVLRNRHRLAHDFFAGKLADDEESLPMPSLAARTFFSSELSSSP